MSLSPNHSPNQASLNAPLSNGLSVGIDLGGTQLRLAAVTHDGQLASDVLAVPTGLAFAPADLQLALAELLKQVNQQTGHAPLQGWGLGITGVIWQQRLTQSDFLPKLNDIDLCALVRECAGAVPVILENDARCFVYAETRFGAARGARNVCGITLGTGVGGGVIIDGKLVTGTRREAGEIWRIPLREAHLEHFVSTTGLLRGYQVASEQQHASLTSVQIADAARQGDAAARQAWQAYGDDVYFLCETMISLLEPEVIVIGGSMAQAHDLFGARFHEKLAQRATRIAFAELGSAAGLIGAAALSHAETAHAAS